MFCFQQYNDILPAKCRIKCRNSCEGFNGVFGKILVGTLRKLEKFKGTLMQI